MHIRDLPDRTQDYLKAIWDVTEYEGKPAPLGEIAKRVEQKTSTASEAIKRLAAQDLVNHEPYTGITLTEKGNAAALQMVRRHRVLETVLVKFLDYSWDEVHVEADLLEHSISDGLLAKLEVLLGHPTHDPHGDPIPRADGTVPTSTHRTLAETKPGDKVTIAQVDDQQPELLRYLAEHQLGPGSEITISTAPTAGILTVLSDAGETVILAESTLRAIRVQ